jgi:predicted RNA-binding Zn-ribbon protein involved in translation (DUF1610 family)
MGETMGNVLSFAAAKTEAEPYCSGWAKCAICHHRYVAVAPVGTWVFECPNCHYQRSFFEAQCERDETHWECNCGNKLFCLTPKGMYCPNCGDWQLGWDEKG